MNALTKALKDVVGKGTSFQLELKKNNFNEIALFVSGGVSDITLRLPFNYIGIVDFTHGFKWNSTTRTLETLSAAIEALPEEASPTIWLDAQEWDGAGLLLQGTWEKKGKGRSKESQKQIRTFLFDAGVLVPE